MLDDQHSTTTTTPTRDAPVSAEGRTWTFLTNHAHVLLAVHRDPGLRQREIAEQVGITEGATQRILTELEECGYVRRERIGRRNRYSVHAAAPLRHPMEASHSVGELLEALRPGDDD